MMRLDGCEVSALPLPDRGLDFGDGLFETLLVRDGQPLFLDLHLQRLERGLAVLGFPDCLAAARTRILEAAAAGSSDDPATGAITWASLRLTVTRGGGPRGYAPPREPAPRLLTRLLPIGRNCEELATPATLAVAQTRWPTQPLLAGIKHLNRLEQVLAAAEAGRAGVDDVVMLDQRGRLISVSSGNLFLVHGDRLSTAALEACGIAGTRRRLVTSRWAPELGLETVERELGLDDLRRADEVFYCNSLTGMRPVGSFESRQWSSHPVCKALHARCQAGRSC